MALTAHKIGDKVKFISKRDYIGEIVSEIYLNPDGQERVDIKWDDNGKVTTWHPDLLIPLSVEYEDLPDVVTAGGMVYLKNLDEVLKLSGLFDSASTWYQAD